MRVAITGASGHVGAAICRQMLADGHEVWALVYRDTRALKGLPLERVPGTVSDPAALTQLMHQAEVVIHAAGLISIGHKSDAALSEVNVEGTKNALETALNSGVRRFIYISSVHAFKNRAFDQRFDESGPLADAGDYPYARSKATAQKMVLRTKGIETIVLNPTSVLGPWDFKPSLQGHMLSDFSKGKLPVIPPGGFDWVDNRDIALACSKALTKGTSGEAYLLGGRYASLWEIGQQVAALNQVRGPWFRASFQTLRVFLPFVYVYGKIARKEPLYTRESLDHLQYGHPMISIEKARNELGFSPRPLEETLMDSVHWLKTNLSHLHSP
jgi:dihydroflavonol-4-reductase